MITLEEFRTGQLSIPVTDLDSIPDCCFACPSLAYKEFSVGQGLYYYFCGYYWQDETTRRLPPCLGAEI